MLKRNLPDEIDEDNLDLYEAYEPDEFFPIDENDLYGIPLSSTSNKVMIKTTAPPEDYFDAAPEPAPKKINKEQQELNEKIEKGFRKLKL